MPSDRDGAPPEMAAQCGFAPRGRILRRLPCASCAAHGGPQALRRIGEEVGFGEARQAAIRKYGPRHRRRWQWLGRDGAANWVTRAGRGPAFFCDLSVLKETRTYSLFDQNQSLLDHGGLPYPVIAVR